MEQQDFASMFEEYMDQEEINEIIENDEMDDEQQHGSYRHQSTESKFPESIAISINDFVSIYLGIDYTPGIIEETKTYYTKDEKTGKRHSAKKTTTRTSYKTLWHQGLKDIGSPFVMGVSNEYANKNPDRVYDGELLLVIDSKGNRGTYINPRYLQELLHNDELKKELSILRRTGVRDLELLADYMDECLRLQTQIENNKKFERMLRETHKIGKFKELKKEIKHD